MSEKKYTMTAHMQNSLAPEGELTESQVRDFAKSMTGDPVWLEKFDKDPISTVIEHLDVGGFKVEEIKSKK